MATRQWIFLSNTFLVNTEGSFKKALSLFTDTHAKLRNEQADPDIAAMFAELDPVYQAYVTIYTNWEMTQGTYKGKTAGVEEILLEKMPVNLRLWEGAVRAVFPEDSPTETEIFPNKRSPFLSGTYEQRIMAVGALANKLTEYAALNATQLLVASFYNTLESTRLRQQEKEGDVKRLSTLLENQRIIVCRVMYGILGLLMHKYQTDTDDIARFFDLSLIRRTGVDDNETEEPEPEEPQPDEPAE